MTCKVSSAAYDRQLWNRVHRLALAPRAFFVSFWRADSDFFGTQAVPSKSPPSPRAAEIVPRSGEVRPGHSSQLKMDFFVDIDNIEESTNHMVHMVAGSLAGIMEHCGMFPLDTIRTHQQSLVSHGVERVSVSYTYRSIVKTRGVRALFRGLPIMAASVGPIHGLSFTVYEFCKVVMGANRPGVHPISAASAGVCATLVHDACLTPIDMVKQRLQRGAVEYKGVGDVVMRGYRLHGMRGFYAGYTTALTMNLPYGAVYYGTYETLKRTISGEITCTNPIVHMLAGAGAGIAAGGVTNPLDVAKTRLQVGTDLGKSYRGMVRTFQQIYKEEGLGAFSRGIVPRMAVHSMSAAMLWTTYEYVKWHLT